MKDQDALRVAVKDARTSLHNRRSTEMLVSDDDQEVLRGAFKDALKSLVADGAERVTPPDMVRWVVGNAMDTLRRMPDREAGWLYGQRSLWPDIARNYAERLAAFEQELKALLSGEGDSPRKTPASPLAIRRMHIVFGLFPYLVVGRNRRRDYRILSGMAGGQTSTRLAREIGCHQQTVMDRLKVQLAAIAHRLSKLMPKEYDIELAVSQFDVDRRSREERLESSGLSG